MLKSRLAFVAAVLLLLVLGISLFNFTTSGQEPLKVFPATVNRDCAPWDGGAFTVTILYDTTTPITISIWQSPDIKRPVTFSFPDETMQIGAAYSIMELDPLEMLIGDVTFQSVEQGIPVEGEFDLKSEGGKQFKGRFKAEWGNEIVICG